jgi:Protein of unknown function (DUF2949)
MATHHVPEFINFLRQDLGLPPESVQLALKQSQSNYGTLPMILWQYGLVTLPQFDQIFDWLEFYIY